MEKLDDVYIVEALRTPRTLAKIDGLLSGVRPVDLMTQLFEGLLTRWPKIHDHVESLALGCVGQIKDQGANIAHTSLVYSGYFPHAYGVSINGYCASGLEAVYSGFAKIKSGQEHLVLVGGVESLSKVPMFADQGAWFYDPKVKEKARFLHMGLAADLLAQIYGFDRDQLDSYALRSHQLAFKAQNLGYFEKDIIPIRLDHGETISKDNAIRPETSLEKLSQIVAKFKPDEQDFKHIQALLGEKTWQSLHHVGIAPQMVDGASLLLLASGRTIEQDRHLGLKPRAKILGCAGHGSNPITMLTGHTKATAKLLSHLKLSMEDIDVIEANESFAASVLAFQKDLLIPEKKLNPNGGAISLGHPLGATGGVLLCNVLGELERKKLRYGLAAIPGGAGLGMSIALELVR